MAQVMPHVRDCDFCGTCHVDMPKETNLGYSERTSGSGRKLSLPLLPEPSSEPEKGSAPAKCGIRQCAECYGCQHRLTNFSEITHFKNTSIRQHDGLERAHVFRIENSSKQQPRKQSVVKLWGLPVWDKKSNRISHCDQSRGDEMLKVSKFYSPLRSMCKARKLRDIDIALRMSQCRNEATPYMEFNCQ